MTIQDVLKDVKNLTSYQIEQRLDMLMRKNPKFKHLDQKNQDLVLDLIKKYRDKIKSGIGVSGYTLREEHYRLYEKRLQLGLTLIDLKTIKELLEEFKTD